MNLENIFLHKESFLTDIFGSKEVLIEAIEILSEEHVETQLVSDSLLAQAYDEYGLPDGSLKLFEEYGKKIVPTSEQLCAALLNTIADGLDEKLLSIPVGIANMSSATAYTFVDSRGGVAIVLSSVLFGALYIANEILEILQDKHKEQTVDPFSKSESLGNNNFTSKSHIFRNCIIGFGTKMPQGSLKFHNNNELSIQSKAKTFLYTSAMQAFFLLHEFGHIALGHLKNNERKPKEMRRFSLHRRSLEMQADLWAWWRMLKWKTNNNSADISITLEATIRCFAFFEFLRQHGWFSTDQEHPSPYFRWEQLAGWASPMNIARPKSHFWYRSEAEGIKNYLRSYFKD